MAKPSLKPILVAILAGVALALGVALAVTPRAARADEHVYTVILDPGEGTGERIVYRSDEGQIAIADWQAQNCQFYRNDDGSMGFLVNRGYCPDTFEAPEGLSFNGWGSPTFYFTLTEETTTLTAQWTNDPILLYGPIEQSTYALIDEDGEHCPVIPAVDGGFVYMGGIEWRVIGMTDTEWLLISAEVLGENDDINAWRARQYCRDLYDTLFTDAEREAITGTPQGYGDDGTYRICPNPYTWENVEIEVRFASHDHWLFPLSVAEICYYLPVLEGEDGDFSLTNRLPGGWWTRPTNSDDGTYGPEYVDEGGIIREPEDGHGNFALGVRPAFQLWLEQIFFMSAAEGGKSDATELGQLGAIRAASTETVEYEYEWDDTEEVDEPVYKLTLRDYWWEGSFSASVDTTTAAAGGTLNVTYDGAATDDNEYVSAALLSADGTPLYYGNLAHASASGTAELTIPAELTPGEYTLAVFSEQCNGDYETDYARGIARFALTVTASVPGGATEPSSGQEGAPGGQPQTLQQDQAPSQDQAQPPAQTQTQTLANQNRAAVPATGDTYAALTPVMACLATAGCALLIPRLKRQAHR